ncbi:4235_t:CDS:2 [Ambispora leptoticha]|uniref:4235_t:CDS:1 n=1 Tax=Ambispora leptoticha TaxID=144679 RepID=A0A9N9F570_9GLOM|nr:4235_t:CDS:2 [Ambispora leptoticha]
MEKRDVVDWVYTDNTRPNGRFPRGTFHKRRPGRRPYYQNTHHHITHANYQNTRNASSTSNSPIDDDNAAVNTTTNNNYASSSSQPINNYISTVNGGTNLNPHHYVEFYLKRIEIEDYTEQLENVDDYKLLKFRYKYMQETISIFFNEGRCKIFLPLDVLDAVNKIQSDTIVLIFKPDAKHMISYDSREIITDGEDTIRQSLNKATQIRIVANDATPQQPLDLCGLHINYQLNKRNKGGQGGSHVTNWGRISPSLPPVPDEMIIKCHVGAKENEEIRILRFPISTLYEDIKKDIQEAFGLTEIRKLKYKDDESEFISICNSTDFETAYKLYARNKRLEVWIISR